MLASYPAGAAIEEGWVTVCTPLGHARTVSRVARVGLGPSECLLQPIEVSSWSEL